jgi:hypothetical protein
MFKQKDFAYCNGSNRYRKFHAFCDTDKYNLNIGPVCSRCVAPALEALQPPAALLDSFITDGSLLLYPYTKAVVLFKLHVD